MTNKSIISFCGKTDVGKVRKNNEDAYVAQVLWDESTYLAIAIDGVGGYDGGEIAAEIASKKIPEFLSASSNGERVELLKQAVTAANNAIFDAREADPTHGQMSCVLTAAIIDVSQKQISMAHVGDSRLYSFHHGDLIKLSHDHSIVGFREEIGDLSEEEAMHHPQRNVIGRDVGSQRHKVNDDDFIESQVFPLLPNTTLLLCSDGLTDLITSTTISNILARKEPLENKADLLIDSALEAGGKDNVTVVLFEYQDDEMEVKETEKAQKPEDANLLHQISVNKPDEVYDNKSKTGQPGKCSNWPVYIVIGLLTGAVSVFAVMNGTVRELRKELKEQQECYSDSIHVLYQKIDSLFNPTDSLGTGNTILSIIDNYQRQNDSLKFQLFEAEKHNEQLEKEVKLLVNQFDAD